MWRGGAQIQTVDNSSRGDLTIDPDLPPELRAALAAERREQVQQQQSSFAPMQQPPRPYSSFAGAGPALAGRPLKERWHVQSYAVMCIVAM